MVDPRARPGEFNTHADAKANEGVDGITAQHNW